MTRPTPPKGYRYLKPGELPRPNDVFCNGTAFVGINLKKSIRNLNYFAVTKENNKFFIWGFSQTFSLKNRLVHWTVARKITQDIPFWAIFQ